MQEEMPAGNVPEGEQHSVVVTEILQPAGKEYDCYNYLFARTVTAAGALDSEASTHSNLSCAITAFHW